MRTTVVAAQTPAEATELLRDLGCATREASALAPPAELAANADVVLVEAGDDAEVGRFVVGRLRSLPSRVPTLLALRTTQLTRLDAAWGHDDFVLQPYVPQELYARLRAVEWRTSEFAQPERIKVGPLVVDVAGHEVVLDGARVAVAPMEFALLAKLAEHRGRVLGRTALLRDLWGRRGGVTRTLDVHVRKLRARLGDRVVIETVRGVGYRMVAPDTTPLKSSP
ncbi:MAG: response regulator transcription factor [Polyangiales bacterium]